MLVHGPRQTGPQLKATLDGLDENPMRLTQRLWTLAVGLSLACLATQRTEACSCIVPPPPLEAAARADVVFIGTVATVTEERDPGDGWLVRWVKELFDREIDYGYWQYAVQFDVSAVVKGDPTESTVIRTNTTSPACGYSFRGEIEYLVYAYSDDGKFYTSLCSRTTPTEGAADEIQELMSDGGQPSNNTLKLTVRLVTVLACARSAPGRPAA